MRPVVVAARVDAALEVLAVLVALVEVDLVEVEAVEADRVLVALVEVDLVDVDLVEVEAVEADRVLVALVEVDLVDADLVDVEAVDAALVDADLVEVETVEADRVLVALAVVVALVEALAVVVAAVVVRLVDARIDVDAVVAALVLVALAVVVLEEEPVVDKVDAAARVLAAAFEVVAVRLAERAAPVVEAITAFVVAALVVEVDTLTEVVASAGGTVGWLSAGGTQSTLLVPEKTFAPVTVPIVARARTNDWASTALSEGVVANARMIAPARNGEAMLVPRFFPVRPPGSVDRIMSPGA